MLNNQSIKTRLTQNLKAKHISNAHIKTRRMRVKEREEIPNDIWHSNFAMPKHTGVIL